MDILIGTKNPYKSAEMVSFFKGLKNIKIHYLDELKENIKVNEDQNSLKGNAIKKATEISNHTDYFVLTSDGGVNIPGLENKWDLLKNQMNQKFQMENGWVLFGFIRNTKKYLLN